MKRFILAFAFCAIVISVHAQTVGNNGYPINFSTELVDPTSSTINRPRGPVCPPEAMLSGHTLYILTSHGDYDLQLLSSDGTVVFETFVPSSFNEIQLPANLTGDYELQLQTQRFIFTGEVEL